MTEETTSNDNDEDGHVKYVPIRVAKLPTMGDMSEAPEIVRTTGSGLTLLLSHPNLMGTIVASASQGVMQVVPNHPFKILIAYFTKKPMQIMKHMLVALGLEAQNVIVEIPGRTKDDGDDTVEKINGIPHSKEKEAQEVRFKRHRTVEE